MITIRRETRLPELRRPRRASLTIPGLLGILLGVLPGVMAQEAPAPQPPSAATTTLEPPATVDADAPSDAAPSDAAESVAAPSVAAESVAAALADAPPTTRLEALIEFEALMETRRFDEAAEIAEILLELTAIEFGEESREAAAAHHDLAEAQRYAGRFDDAELNYLRSIELYRAQEGPFTPLAIEPTIGLGDNYHDDDQHLNAVSAYNEARSVQRRVYGLLSEEQIVVLDRISRSFVAMQMGEEANQQQLDALALIERSYPAGSDEVLAAIYRYAGWLRSVGRYFDERAQYERAIRIIRNDYGKEDLRLIQPYREIGNSFRDQAFEDPRGASALNTALAIIESHESDPGIDALTFAETLRDVADWKTAFGPTGAGHDDYRKAWLLLAQVETGEALRTEWFGGRQPRFVLYERLSTRDLSHDPLDPDAVDGHVLVQFDLDVYGRAENIVIVESNPVGFKDEAAVRSIRLSRFRPHMDFGEFVPMSGLAIQISFSYVPDDGS